MNTKILASIAVFALLAGVISTSMMQSVYAAETSNKAMIKKTETKAKVDAKKTETKAKVDAKKTVTKAKVDAKKAVATSKATKVASSKAVTVEMAKGSGSDTSCADKCYTPSSVQIKVGGTVTWKNVDSAAHFATSGKDATADGNFDSGMVNAGKTFSQKFDKAGTFDYFCLVHPWMTGKVTVS